MATTTSSSQNPEFAPQFPQLSGPLTSPLPAGHFHPLVTSDFFFRTQDRNLSITQLSRSSHCTLAPPTFLQLPFSLQKSRPPSQQISLTAASALAVVDNPRHVTPNQLHSSNYLDPDHCCYLLDKTASRLPLASSRCSPTSSSPLHALLFDMSLNSEVLAARALSAVLTPATTTEVLLLTPSPYDTDHDEKPRPHLFGKVTGLLQRTLSRSRENSVSLCLSDATGVTGAASRSGSVANLVKSRLPRSPRLTSISARPSRVSLVKETNHVSLEYDPITRRKVLNTYEILREIGRGEHGRVKLARDLVHDELVAIKIVSRKSKKERQLLRMRRPSNLVAGPNRQHNNNENKIRREIAIMKRCDHKNIVQLKEVLDDMNLYKIYLVLEYMDRGEIKWKRRTPIVTPRPFSDPDDQKLPCCVNQRSITASEDNELLTDDYSPNLTFRQLRRIFRDVLLGLEYLHMQGIVHRDIKPANLLVSLDYVVKISDFGVSFASSLGSSDDGELFNDMELAKTVGTPAFFAPELCQTNFSASSSTVNFDSTKMMMTPSGSFPKVNHKIDIWALGVTLYCLLFGKVPFNAESEFKLFDVIVNEPLGFPSDAQSFNSPQEVSPEEFEMAKDLLSKMLDKDSTTRIDIPDIKEHPFVLMDLEDDVKKLDELFFFNANYVAESDALNNLGDKVLQEEIDNAVVGVGARIRSNILRAMKNADSDALRKLLLKMESSLSATSSSEDSSYVGSQLNLVSQLFPSENSVILSEALQESTLRNSYDYFAKQLPLPLHLSHHTHIQSHLSQPPHLVPNQSPLHSSNASFVSRGSVSLRNNLILLDIESPSSSRKGSVSGILEAPQIETKRNVGGDLYLKNQSAIDAFKDIQVLDQKRRRLSVFTSLSQSHNSSVSTPTKTSEDSEIPANIVSKQEKPSRIKVGPIRIDKCRRPSSVISLPLTESFASLDSLNDDYLSLKYMEFRKQKRTDPDPGVTNSDSALRIKDATTSISEKFEKFNLGTLMAGASPKLSEEFKSEDIAPHARGYSSSRSLSFSSVSSSCSSGSGSDSDEGGGDLTVNFISKVAPKSRPPFLSLSKRAQSHESNLPNLANQQSSNYYDVPIVFQDHLLELEDVPVGLMGAPREDSGFDPTDMTPTASTLTGLASSATITQDVQGLRFPKKASAQSSPLRKEITSESPTDLGGFAKQDNRKVPTVTGSSPRPNGYFNNHYKKESIKSPFPLANHLEGDLESQSKRDLKGQARPTALRSNSITVGLLQRERSVKET